LVVDPNTELTFPVTVESFETIAWGRRQVSKVGRRIQLSELAQRDALKSSKAQNALAPKKLFGQH